jgi:hypothetical protein
VSPEGATAAVLATIVAVGILDILVQEDGDAHRFSVDPALLPTNCSRMAARTTVHHVVGATSGCAAWMRRAEIDDTSNGYCVCACLGT